MKNLLFWPAAWVFIFGTALCARAADLSPSNGWMLSPLPVSSNDIVASNNQLSLDFAETHVDYLETDPVLGPLDSEKAWLPGLSASYSFMSNWFVENLYLYGQFTWATDHTQYVGALQGNPYGSLTDSDGAQIYDEDVRVGKGFSLDNSLMLTPYIGAGAHQWSRNISGASGYHENYSHGYAGGGLLIEFSPVSKWVVSTYGLAGSTFDAKMNSSLTPGGFPINPQTYNLGSSLIFKAGGSIDYAITQQIHANAGVDYTNFSYGKSAVSQLDGSFEPSSRTSDITLKAGLGYAF